MKLLCTIILPGHASLRLLGLRLLTAWLSALDKSSEAGKDFAAECNKTDLLPKLLSQQQLDPPSSEEETIFRECTRSVIDFLDLTKDMLVCFHPFAQS
jgi:hypothetical protein